MTIDRKEVELLIRAKLQGKASLEDVTKSIEALSRQIDEQSAAAKRGEGSIGALVAAEKKLKQAQDELGAQADIIGSFQKASATAETLAARVSKTGKAYEDLKTRLASSAEVTDEQQQRLVRLSAAHQRAQQAQARQQAQVATLAVSMQAAGVAADNLAEAETRVRTAAGLIGLQVAKARDAISGFADQTTKAAAGASTLGKASSDLQPRVVSVRDALNSIKTSSLVAEVVTLAAAYSGLQAAIGLAGKSAEAFSTREGVKNQLSLSVGTDRKAIDAEYAYVKAQADRIGVEFESATKGYAKFSAAATLAGRSRQEIRYIFEAFTEVSRVANLSTEDLSGVFRALEQIISKGKIQAEELRGQLGDRLFGAFQVAAQALKATYPDLDKALKDGVVTSDQLLAIAEKYRSTVGVQLGEATNSLAAKQARLNNAIADFKLTVADGGFAESFAWLLERLTELLRSDDGEKFAKDKGAAFAAVADAIGYVLSHLAELKLGLTILAGLWAANKLKAVTGDFIDLGKAIRASSGEVGLFTKSFAALQAFAVGFSIGSYLYDQFAIVRKAGAVLVVSYEAAWSKIVYGAMLAFEEIPTYAENAFKSVANSATKGTRTLLSILASGARAIGNTGLAEGIEAAIAKLTLTPAEVATSRVKQLRKAAEEDQKRIREIGLQMIADADATQNGTIRPKAATALPTTKPDIKLTKPGPTEGDISKRQREVDAINRALEIIQAKIDRAQTDSLSKQLDAIDVEYQALARKVRALGGKEAASFLAQLNSDVQQLKLQTTKKFNDKLLAETEAIQSKIEQAEVAAGRKQKTDLDLRLKAVSDSWLAAYRDIESLRADLQNNNLSSAPADEAKKRLDAAVIELQQLERINFIREQLERRERGINDLLRERELLIQSTKADVTAGTKTQSQGDSSIRDIVKESQPGIDAAIKAAEEFARANSAAFDTAKLQEFLAKLKEAKVSGTALNAEFDRTGQIIKTGIDGGITSAFDAMYQSLGALVQKTGDWGDVFESVGRSILGTLAQVLKELALTIIKQELLIVLQAISGTGGAGAGASVSSAGSGTAVPVAHSGGLVGNVSRRRAVSPSWFANAPRYHAGGIAGLAADEYATILQKNEEVLKTSDPRNVLNGGLSIGKPQGDIVVRNVLIDDRARVPELMAGAEGERVIVQAVQRNIATIRQFVKG